MEVFSTSLDSKAIECVRWDILRIKKKEIKWVEN